MLKGRITEKAQAHLAATKSNVTTADLQKFYDSALEEVQTAFGVTPTDPANTSAATDAKAVADKAKKDNAAAERAQKASKTIDGGTGQRASRHPAIAKDAPLASVIDTLWDELAEE